MLRFIAIAALWAMTACQVWAKPLPIRVWQLHDYNMEHIHRLIDMAAEQRINRIQLSHNIVMDVEEPLSKPQLVKDINTICEWAHEKNIRVDMWTHELNGIPRELLKDGKADLNDPRLWEFVKGKYTKLFELCPDLDGLVLTMHETAMSIYHDTKVSSSTTPEQRVAKLIDSMDDVCKSFGKEFFVRTFSYEPAELKYIQGGLKECKADVIVMTKCCPHDWQPYYPFNPAIGDVGGKRQVVEFDLGHEYLGLATVPYININYLKKHLDYDVSKGIIGAVIRVERLKWRAVDTPNQANIDVFTKMLLNPTANPHALFKNWLADRYGEAAMPHLYNAFMRTEEATDKCLFTLGFWMSNHSLLPSYDYAKDHLYWLTTAKWDPSYADLEKELFNPTPATLKKIAAEKDFALNHIEQSAADIEKARPYLTADDYAQLTELFARSRAMAIVWKAAMETIFGIDVYKATGSARDRAYLAKAAKNLERVTQENKDLLIRMASDYVKPDRISNIDASAKIVAKAREVLAQESVAGEAK